ncbi:hypothetical protein H2508_01635 [Parahaliea sp. F7430]|uniref:Type II secretion system protein H n=1 Tax=Sediminihaliea albiluteola TaxID=2758564 RepID=A0A7W2TTW7_9GAMM|nr:GspH/FimT family pseudopilin [Sediminihaliea albiluteola]MBA6411809.1 hypothetical protein [Sediminihaliea albiluteola]
MKKSPYCSLLSQSPLGRALVSARGQKVSASGFSLIELLIVLAVAIVLLLIAIPSFQDQRAKSHVKEATEDVLVLIRQAVAEAPVRDRSMRINLDASTPWCVGVSLGNTTCDCSKADECTVPVAGVDVTRVVSGASYPSVTLSHNFSGASTVFEPVRGRASDEGKVTLSNGDWALELRISSEGLIRVCNPMDNAITGYEAC